LPELISRKTLPPGCKWRARSSRKFLEPGSETNLSLKLNVWKCELQNFSPRGNADDEKDQAHHEEEKEQEFRNFRGGRGDAGKSKQGGDESDDEENYSPT
jgi:hypothetical protein